MALPEAAGLGVTGVRDEEVIGALSRKFGTTKVVIDDACEIEVALGVSNWWKLERLRRTDERSRSRSCRRWSRVRHRNNGHRRWKSAPHRERDRGIRRRRWDRRTNLRSSCR